jgi:hypothetical protein
MPLHRPTLPPRAARPTLDAQVEAWCQSLLEQPCDGCLGEGRLWPVGDRWLCADCRGEQLEPPPRWREVA